MHYAIFLYCNLSTFLQQIIYGLFLIKYELLFNHSSILKTKVNLHKY